MSQNIRVTKTFTIDMAHALFGYDGPCKNIHGHTYHLHVTLIGKPIEDSGHPKNGMLIDFTVLKKIVKENIVDIFDHALVLNGNSPHKNISGIDEHFEKVIYADYQPTCENMMLDFQQRIYHKLPENVALFSLKLEETPTSFAEWFSIDNE